MRPSPRPPLRALTKGVPRGLALATLAAGLLALPASAAISGNTIDPTATLTTHAQQGGQTIQVTGQLACSAGDLARVSVRVTQAAHGASAAGASATLTCSGAAQAWSATAVNGGNAAFVPGDAQACAVAKSGNRAAG